MQKFMWIGPVAVIGSMLACAQQRPAHLQDGLQLVGIGPVAVHDGILKVGQPTATEACRTAYLAARHDVDDQRAPAQSRSAVDDAELQALSLALRTADAWLDVESDYGRGAAPPDVLLAFCTPAVRQQLRDRVAELYSRHLLMSDSEHRAAELKAAAGALAKATADLEKALSGAGRVEPSQ